MGCFEQPALAVSLSLALQFNSSILLHFHEEPDESTAHSTKAAWILLFKGYT